MLTWLHYDAQAWFKVTNRFVLVEHRIWSYLPSQMCLVPCAWSYVFDQERMLSVTTLWLVLLNQCKQAITRTGNHAEMIHHISDCCVQLQAVPPHVKALSQDRCDVSSRRGQLAPSLLCGTVIMSDTTEYEFLHGSYNTEVYTHLSFNHRKAEETTLACVA